MLVLQSAVKLVDLKVSLTAVLKADEKVVVSVASLELSEAEKSAALTAD